MPAEQQKNRKSNWDKWIYGGVFTIVNTVICTLITNDYNPWHIVLLLLIFILATFAILFDTLENKFNISYLDFFEKRLSPIFITVIILIFISSIFSNFLPSWSTLIAGTIFDNISYISSSLALLAIFLVFKRDLRYNQTVIEKESVLNSQIMRLNDLTENINNINDRLIKYNPLYSTESTFKNAIYNLKNLSVADVALNFSIESLQQIGTLGFIKIDVSFGDYTAKLFEIVNKSKSSVVGSFTFRPKIINDEIKSSPSTRDNCNLKYLKLLNDKAYSKKIRLVILSLEEIKNMLKDAYNEMEINPALTLEEIPEVNWFKQQASKEFITLWTSKTLFYSQFVNNSNEDLKKLISLPDRTITDFAIFDSDLLISWRKSIEKKSDIADFGTLLISWNHSVKNFYNELISEQTYSAKHLYTDFMSLVNQVQSQDNEIYNYADLIKSRKDKGYKWINNYNPIKY